MGERLGQTAHALFLPASFEPRERDDVATLFPSKLADYTAVGLPVLIWGPTYSSAVRWAIENPAAAVCASTTDSGALTAAIRRIVADASYATGLAAAAVRAGSRCFDQAAARSSLYRALRSPVDKQGNGPAPNSGR